MLKMKLEGTSHNVKRIAVFCVTYNSDTELEQYRSSLERAAEKAEGLVTLDIYVARNTTADNPGYFGAVKRLMDKADVTAYDYCIVSNVDLRMEEDFLRKLAHYDCADDTGWIAPRIWSAKEHRDRNPRQTSRYSLRRLKLLRLLYRFPLFDTLYTKTFYRRKKFSKCRPGTVYSGHGSFIILTRGYIRKCGRIDYPVFLFCEEIWLAEKCRQAGLKVVYDPSMTIYDSEHVSTSKMDHRFLCQCNYNAIQYIIRTFYNKPAPL